MRVITPLTEHTDSFRRVGCRRTKVRFGRLEGLARSLIGSVGPGLLTLYLGSTHIDIYRDPVTRRMEERGVPLLYCFWHGRLLVPAFFYRGRGIRILISTAREGEFVARLATGLGFVAHRGSSTRGGREGLMAMLRDARHGHSLAITPDGPQGPRELVQMGAIALARMAHTPIVPCGIALRDRWRAPDWSRLELPMPLTRAVGIIGAPIPVPRRLHRGDMEPYRARVETEMKRLTDLAERAVRDGARSDELEHFRRGRSRF